MRDRPEGFTLIEVMVAVAIIGILLAIALPNYSDYIMRSRIAEATSALSAKRAQMEMYFDSQRTYVGSPACADSPRSSRVFAFSCDPDPPTASAYKLQAVGEGTMADFIFTINQDNAKATTGVPSGWTRNLSCWISSKSGTC